MASFSKKLIKQAKISKSKKFFVTVNQFSYFSYTNNHIDSRYFQSLSIDLPVFNEYEYVVKSFKEKHVIASINEWENLFGSNPWAEHEIVARSRAYPKPPHCGDGLKVADNLEPFIRNGLGGVDLPFLRPPDLALYGRIIFSLQREVLNMKNKTGNLRG